MQRILTSTVAGTLIAASLVAGAAVTTTTADAGAASAPAQRTGTVTTYVAHDMHNNLAMADIADPKGGGPDIGDVLAFTQRLTRNGHRVGKVSNSAIGVDHRDHLFQSNGTMRLAHGTITFSGLVSQTPRFVLAVTGGTGDYRGAAGTLTFHSDGQRQLLTLRLAR